MLQLCRFPKWRYFPVDTRIEVKMISPDLPITKVKDDVLSRSSFAKNLAQTLLEYSCSSPFSVGLYGKWGSGKTSLLNMIIEEIEAKQSSAVVLRFNPWLCSDPRQLISQFFKQLETAISRHNIEAKKILKNVCELVAQYAGYFDIIPNPFTGGVPIATIVGKVCNMAIHFGKRKTVDLQVVKDEIVKKLGEAKLKIIVAIDDIDRLSKEEIVAVFQLVKALADFPNTIYLLAFDYEVVIQALKDVQYGEGRAYLEKIIQVPFEIPAPNIDIIHKTLFSKLHSIIGNVDDCRWNRVTWARLFEFGIKTYIVSIRDVIRYVNVFSLKYELLKDEADPVDLLGLTCLQVFEPMIYARLPYYKEILCGSVNGYLYGGRKEEGRKIKQAIEDLLSEKISISHVEAARQIMGILFPRIQLVLDESSNMNTGDVSQQRSLIAHNISDESCFERYFSLMLEDDSIPLAIVKNLIYNQGEEEVTSVIQQIYQKGKIVRLLDEIQEYAREQSSLKIPSEWAIVIFKVLSRLLASFHERDTDVFSYPLDWRYRSCVASLLPLIEEAVRYPEIRNVFEDSQVRPVTLASLLYYFERQHGRFTEHPKERGQIIALTEVLELEQIFVSKTLAAINSGNAIEDFGGLRFLWLLERIHGKLSREEKAKMISDDISLAKVISYCTSHGTMSTGKVEAEVRFWKINMNMLLEFIDVKSAYQRMSGFVRSKDFEVLLEDFKKDVIAFMCFYEKPSPDKKESNEIFEEEIERKQSSLHGTTH